MKRPIIEIDEEKCNGCGQCVPDCAEGALAVIDGKARLISEVFCDGLGACLNCPQGALTLTTREAPDFDEAAALAAKAQRETPNSPDRPAPMTPPAGGCPGSAARVLRPLSGNAAVPAASEVLRVELPTWPIQLRLVPPQAPFLDGAHLLLAAHCAGFALPNLHKDWLAGRLSQTGRQYGPAGKTDGHPAHRAHCRAHSAAHERALLRRAGASGRTGPGGGGM